MSFHAIRENKILAKISGFTVTFYNILTMMPPSLDVMPAKDAGLSPVKATTLHSAENPYFLTKYGEIVPCNKLTK